MICDMVGKNVSICKHQPGSDLRPINKHPGIGKFIIDSGYNSDERKLIALQSDIR